MGRVIEKTLLDPRDTFTIEDESCLINCITDYRRAYTNPLNLDPNTQMCVSNNCKTMDSKESGISGKDCKTCWEALDIFNSSGPAWIKQEEFNIDSLNLRVYCLTSD